MGEDLDLVRFPDSDFVAITRGFGLDGATVRRPEDLAAVSEWLRRDDRGPFLLDCKVVPTVVADYQAEAFVGH
jgi:thiamine pyrophosphate-dependent acetolactate synthase large subunit-like protein